MKQSNLHLIYHSSYNGNDTYKNVSGFNNAHSGTYKINRQLES